MKGFMCFMSHICTGQGLHNTRNNKGKSGCREEERTSDTRGNGKFTCCVGWTPSSDTIWTHGAQQYWTSGSGAPRTRRLDQLNVHQKLNLQCTYFHLMHEPPTDNCYPQTHHQETETWLHHTVISSVIISLFSWQTVISCVSPRFQQLRNFI